MAQTKFITNVCYNKFTQSDDFQMQFIWWNVCFHFLEGCVVLFCFFLSTSSFTSARTQQQPKHGYDTYKGQISAQLNTTTTAQLEQFKKRSRNSTPV